MTTLSGKFIVVMVDALGVEISQSKLFEVLYKKALTGDADGGGLLAYNYLSGEPITHLEEGRPLLRAHTGKPLLAFELHACASFLGTGYVEDRNGPPL